MSLSPTRMQRIHLAWLFWALCIALGVVSYALRLANLPALREEMGLRGMDLFYEILMWTVLVPASVPAYATAGAVIAARHPRNGIGWLSLILALMVALVDTFWQIAARAALHDVSTPISQAADWAAGWLSALTFAPLPLALMVLIFPDGRLLSPRWRYVAWGAVGAMLLLTAAPILKPSIYEARTPAAAPPNGLAVFEPLEPLAQPLAAVGLALSLTTFVAALISAWLRWQRARGIEREQIKWLGMVSVFIAVFTVLGLVVASLPGHASMYQAPLALALAGATLGIPLALGVAILKYRLYQVDVIIQRTLIYGVLSVILLAIYVGSVMVIQPLLQALIGHESDVAVMISTLLVAVLFGPLHDRIRRVMDRRFFRSKYDAERIIETFGMQLRTEVDLERLTARLIAVVYETAQPAQVSLWLVNRNLANAAEEQD